MLVGSNHKYPKIDKEYTEKNFIMIKHSPFFFKTNNRFEVYNSVLVWVTPETNPKTRLRVQVVYLGGNSKR